jgi:hypothetical protein
MEEHMTSLELIIRMSPSWLGDGMMMLCGTLKLVCTSRHE